MQDSPPADSVPDGSASELSANSTLRRSCRIPVCERDGSHTRAAAKLASLSIVVDSAQDCSGKQCVVATLLRPPLFANHVADGEECYIPNDYFIIDDIIHGLYADSLGCTVFLCHVSGDDDSGHKFSRIIWECQEVDLPSRMVSTYLSEVDNAEGNHVLPPEAALVAEAYENARIHITGFDSEDSGSPASSEDEGDWSCKRARVSAGTAKGCKSKRQRCPKRRCVASSSSNSSSDDHVARFPASGATPQTLNNMRSFTGDVRLVRKAQPDAA
eukprot:3202870-Rhodomonas_salina.1